MRHASQTVAAAFAAPTAGNHVQMTKSLTYPAGSPRVVGLAAVALIFGGSLLLTSSPQATARIDWTERAYAAKKGARTFCAEVDFLYSHGNRRESVAEVATYVLHRGKVAYTKVWYYRWNGAVHRRSGVYWNEQTGGRAVVRSSKLILGSIIGDIRLPAVSKSRYHGLGCQSD